VPQTRTLLKQCLDRMWQSPELTNNADFMNWAACDAITCLEHLFLLNEAPASCRTQYDTLISHACERVRDDARHRLARFFESEA
jgi:hypothetical protein